MKGTLTLIAGPAKCGKTGLANFLTSRESGPVYTQDWPNFVDADEVKAETDKLSAKVKEGWHVIITATTRKGQPFGAGSTPFRLLGAADRVIELHSYYGEEA